MSWDINIDVNGRWRRPSEIRCCSSPGTWPQISEGLFYSGAARRWVRFWPPRDPPAVDTFNSTATHLWHHLSGGWFPGVWGTRPEQGSHPGTSSSHRGIWLYNSAAWRTILARDDGRIVTRVEIFLHRTTGHIGWGSSGPVRPTIWTHGLTSRPGGRPSLHRSFLAPAFARGESKWVTLPRSWGAHMASGDIRGFGVFASSGGPYAAFRSRSDQDNSGRIRISHE